MKRYCYKSKINNEKSKAVKQNENPMHTELQTKFIDVIGHFCSEWLGERINDLCL